MLHLIARLAGDRSGALALSLALSLAPLSVAALGAVDIAMVVSSREQLQDALDAAALAGARDGGDNEDVVVQVASDHLKTVMQAYQGVASYEATFKLTDSDKVVAAEGSRPVSTVVLSFVTGGPTVVRAESRVLRERAKACVIALNPTASGALSVGGSTRVTLNECSAQVNSRSAQAFDMGGSSSLTAQSVDVAGGAGSIGGTLNAPLNVGAPVVPDPLADLVIPTPRGCNRTNYAADSSERFAPAGSAPFVFCGGLHINGGTITFGPGVYIIDGGPLEINGNTKVVGQGVTFVLTGRAFAKISGGSDVTLSAPKDGPTAGVVFMQERVATGQDNTFNGGAAQRLTGGLYFPRQVVRFNGNQDTSGGGCTFLYADTISWIGDGSLSLSKCAGGLGARVRLIR